MKSPKNKKKTPLWRTLKDERHGSKMFLEEGNTSGVSSKRLAAHMLKKYKLTTPVFVGMHSDNMEDFYLPRSSIRPYKWKIKNDIKDDDTKIKDKSYYRRLLKTLNNKKNKLKLKHGLVVIDKHSHKYAPEIVGHEIGHAANAVTSKFRHVDRIINSPLNNVLNMGILASAVGYNAFGENQNIANALTIAAPAAIGITRAGLLYDEYRAHKKGKESIRDLGGKPNEKRVKRSFNSYVNSTIHKGIGLGALLGTSYFLGKKFRNKNNNK